MLHNLPTEIVLEICKHLEAPSLKSLSRINRRLRHAASPEVFHFVKLEGSWKKAEDGLDMLMAESLTCIPNWIQSFRFIIHSTRAYNTQPSATIYAKLANLLSKTQRLHSLQISLPDHEESFRAAFETAGAKLLLVRRLIVTTFCPFFVSLCPNVEQVIIHETTTENQALNSELFFGDASMLDAAGKASRLKEFGFTGSLSITDLTLVREAMPQLTRLGCERLNSISGNFTTFLSIYAEFECLEELFLPSRGLISRIITVLTNEDVTRLLFEECLALRRVWLGYSKYWEVVRDKDGGVESLSAGEGNCSFFRWYLVLRNGNFYCDW